jgi:hypothetical protein
MPLYQIAIPGAKILPRCARSAVHSTAAERAFRLRAALANLVRTLATRLTNSRGLGHPQPNTTTHHRAPIEHTAVVESI